MDENTIRRVQPHNEKAEQGIVGTMLVNRDAISDLVDMLTGEDFYNKQYGILFDNMVELYSEGASVDPITLVERLRMKDIPEEVANTVTLAQLVQSAPLYAPAVDQALRKYREGWVSVAGAGRSNHGARRTEYLQARAEPKRF